MFKKDYYVCSIDAVPHLAKGTKYCYVHKQNHIVGHSAVAGKFVLVDQLSKEDLIYLTLVCKSIVKYKYNHLSTYLQTAVCSFVDNKIHPEWPTYVI